MNLECQEDHLHMNAGSLQHRYKIVESMISLGGLLCKLRPDESLLRYRLSKGDAAFHKFKRHLTGKAPVSLKLAAWAARPRASAIFMSNNTLDSNATAGNDQMGKASPQADISHAPKT